MSKSSSGSIGRRRFLKGAAAGAAAVVAQPVIGAQAPAPPPSAPPSAAPPSDAQLSRDTASPPRVDVSRHIESPQSDFMVDVLRALGIEYVAANPGSSFEGLHESLINFTPGRG